MSTHEVLSPFIWTVLLLSTNASPSLNAVSLSTYLYKGINLPISKKGRWKEEHTGQVHYQSIVIRNAKFSLRILYKSLTVWGPLQYRTSNHFWSIRGHFISTSSSLQYSNILLDSLKERASRVLSIQDPNTRIILCTSSRREVPSRIGRIIVPSY